MTTLFIIFQYLVPQHLLSRLAGAIAQCSWPWLKNALIKRFIDHYDVNMAEAVNSDAEDFEHFNAFFTRELKPGARPIVMAADAIACPADGAISQLGAIEEGRIFQAKGQSYSALELLGGDSELAAQFDGGQFATVYLSPRDYHRVHMPLTGTLRSMTYVPGDLFSVNTSTAEQVPRLFSRNERAVCLFDTAAGPMAVVLVGAMIVAGIETPWAGQVAPLKRQINRVDYFAPAGDIVIEKGQEMGRFKLGSTAIVLFGAGTMQWQDSLAANSPTRMGELFGQLRCSEDAPSQDSLA